MAIKILVFLLIAGLGIYFRWYQLRDALSIYRRQKPPDK